MRLLHLMALVAAVALTLIIAPALMKVITDPDSVWFARERLANQTLLVLNFWTPILALIAMVGNRSRVRRASRSYGTSAVLAASSALLLLFVRIRISKLLEHFPHSTVFPNPTSYFIPMARHFVGETPKGAAAAIVAVWSILALTGAGRRPSDWFDRFCFLFGLLWVLWYLGRDFMFLLPWW